MSQNQKDIDLLFSDPGALLEKHQKTIGVVVHKFVYSGFFTEDERDDVIQYINEKLLNEKFSKMQEQYKPLYYVVTYLSKIVNNLCLEYARAQRRQKRTITPLDLSQMDIADTRNSIDDIIIREECDRLTAILSMYDDERQRIELLLNAVFGIGINEEILKEVFPSASQKDMRKLIDSCTPESDHDRKTDKELFNTLTLFINKYEKKENTPDALRKSVTAKKNEIIRLLNGEPETAHYTKETLKILFQFRYKSFHFRSG